VAHGVETPVSLLMLTNNAGGIQREEAPLGSTAP
jgi:hypothetical protein